MWKNSAREVSRELRRVRGIETVPRQEHEAAARVGREPREILHLGLVGCEPVARSTDAGGCDRVAADAPAASVPVAALVRGEEVDVDLAVPVVLRCDPVRDGRPIPFGVGRGHRVPDLGADREDARRARAARPRATRRRPRLESPYHSGRPASPSRPTAWARRTWSVRAPRPQPRPARAAAGAAAAGPNGLRASVGRATKPSSSACCSVGSAGRAWLRSRGRGFGPRRWSRCRRSARGGADPRRAPTRGR